MAEPIDNEFAVAVARGGSEFCMLLSPRRGEPFSRESALQLAAWLVALADPSQEEFPEVLERVKNGS